MRGLYTSKCGNITQTEPISFVGYLKGKSTLVIYERDSELQSKWDKSLWARGYYVSTIGNITVEEINKYSQE